MKVTKEVWEERMNNLNVRRSKEVIKNSVKGVDNYCGHLAKITVGKTLLDVGAGSGALKKCLPEDVKYVGIDPFPQSSEIWNSTIEENFLKDEQFETVCMFAALDNVIDFKKAIEEIKRVCSKNVLFLTVVNIEPDQYHTIKVTEAMLIDEMKPFKVGYMNYLHEKILLIEFVK